LKSLIYNEKFWKGSNVSVYIVGLKRSTNNGKFEILSVVTILSPGRSSHTFQRNALLPFSCTKNKPNMEALGRSFSKPTGGRTKAKESRPLIG
jgi:hypothetical protein